jgi:hypothetical protein
MEDVRAVKYLDTLTSFRDRHVFNCVRILKYKVIPIATATEGAYGFGPLDTKIASSNHVRSLDVCPKFSAVLASSD